MQTGYIISVEWLIVGIYCISDYPLLKLKYIKSWKVKEIEKDNLHADDSRIRI